MKWVPMEVAFERAKQVADNLRKAQDGFDGAAAALLHAYKDRGGTGEQQERARKFLDDYNVI